MEIKTVRETNSSLKPLHEEEERERERKVAWDIDCGLAFGLHMMPQK